MNKRFRRTYQIPEKLNEKDRERCKEYNKRELFADFAAEVEPNTTYLIKLKSEITHYENTFTKKLDDTIWIYDKVSIDKLLEGSKKALDELLRISAQHNLVDKNVIKLLSEAISEIEEGDNEQE